MLIRWHYRSDRLFFLTSTFPIKIINTKLDNNSNWHCFENRVDRKIVVVRSIFSQCRFSIIEISFFRGLQLIRNSWKFKKFNPNSNYIFHLSWGVSNLRNPISEIRIRAFTQSNREPGCLWNAKRDFDLFIHPRNGVSLMLYSSQVFFSGLINTIFYENPEISRNVTSSIWMINFSNRIILPEEFEHWKRFNETSKRNMMELNFSAWFLATHRHMIYTIIWFITSKHAIQQIFYYFIVLLLFISP